ncbi:hypothetical protein C2G38_2214660 [Gigaspora rosea]|uniref:Uncharacterized protein n=1 Tax=Gigaspora rosea TaxID=44941 RepID=A0A397UAM2_9GLOM|nr:hypothetical protein C2G38_2214660 [Gigaspora rosea]
MTFFKKIVCISKSPLWKCSLIPNKKFLANFTTVEVALLGISIVTNPCLANSVDRFSLNPILLPREGLKILISPATTRAISPIPPMPTGIHTSAFAFIARKKNSIEKISQENINMDIADPIVCKHYGLPAIKRIKLSSKTDLHYSRTNNSALKIIVQQLEAATSYICAILGLKKKNSALNLPDSNLYKESIQHLDNTPALRVLFQSLNINESNNINRSFLTDFLANRSKVKHKYVCQMCDKPEHNTRS